MRRLVIVTLFVLTFCVLLAFVGSRLRGRHKRHAVRIRLVLGLPLLALYVYGVLSQTLIGRTVGATRTAELELFWSHRESLAVIDGTLSVTNKSLLLEIALNVMLFVPLGALLPFLLPSVFLDGTLIRCAANVCMVAGLASFGIEIAQWYFRLGLFEFDDMLNNTIGALMGYALYRLAFRLAKGFDS